MQNLHGVVVFHGSMVNWRRGWGQSIMKLIWCSGLPWMYVQLEEVGWGQSVMKLIQCSGLTWISGQLDEGAGVSLSCKLFGVMVFQRSMLN